MAPKVLAQDGTLSAKDVRVPGIVVDHVVIEPLQSQTVLTPYEPAFSGAVRMPMDQLTPLPLDERKVVARRAAAAGQQERCPGSGPNCYEETAVSVRCISHPDTIARVRAFLASRRNAQ